MLDKDLLPILKMQKFGLSLVKLIETSRKGRSKIFFDTFLDFTLNEYPGNNHPCIS